ncbi:MAG: universal stress protein [Thermodesulfovibrionales bacterium]
MKIQRILLSTDCSEFSSGAEREAINIAKRFKAGLYILSVIETNPEFTALAPGILEKVEEKTRKCLNELKLKVEKEGISSEIVIHEAEEPYKFIIDEASKKGANLIVMGRRGRKGLMRLMMGSQTARTIGHSPVSVLVVPRNARIEFKNIVIATDASKFSEKAAEEAIELAKQTGASLYAIAVTRPDATAERIKESEDALIRIKTTCQKEGVKIETEHIQNRPHEKIYEAIIEFAKRHNADLIVVGSHGRTGLSKLLMGSVAERVIGHSECGVLVVK